ncbi:MAG: hypothetical protein DRP72_04295, partial [Candidatus Omnitrophota bacterium]
MKDLQFFKLLLESLLEIQEGRAPPLELPEETIQTLYNCLFDQDTLLKNNQEKIHIVIFRGGRGASEYTKLLKSLPNVKVSIILGATDDGRSWLIAAHDFDATGVPDCGKSLLDLANDKEVKEFLSSRIKIKGEDEKAIRTLLDIQFYELLQRLIQNCPSSQNKELNKLISQFNDLNNQFKKPKKNSLPKIDENIKNEAIKQKESLLTKFSSIDKNKQIELLKYLLQFYIFLKKYFPDSKFTFNNIPLRSIALVGCAWYYAEKKDTKEDLIKTASWQEAADQIGELLDIGDNKVYFATDKRYHLIAMLEDGTIYFAETGINEHPKKADFIGLWLVEKEEIEKIKQEFKEQNITLTEVESNDEEVRKTTRIVVEKDKIIQAARIIAQHSVTDSLSSKKAEAVESACEAIKDADIIVYSVTSLESNIGSALIVERIQKAIEENKKAVKVYLVNPIVENDPIIEGESPTALDMLNRLYRYVSCQPKYRNTFLDYTSLDKYIHYIIGIGEKIGYKQDKYTPKENEEIKKQTYIPFNQKEIIKATQAKVIPIGLDIEKDEPQEKEVKGYRKILTFGIYDPNVIIKALFSLWAINKSHLFVDEEGKLKHKLLPLITKEEKVQEAVILLFNLYKKEEDLLKVSAYLFNQLIQACAENREFYFSIKDFLKGVIKKSLNLSNKDNAYSLQLLASQTLNILFWMKNNVKDIQNMKVTSYKDFMLQNNKRGLSYLNKFSLPTEEVENEGDLGFYWRGREAVNKLKNSILNEAIIEDNLYNQNKEKLLMYLMNHGFIEVPQDIKQLTQNKRITPIHETFFINDFLPYSLQTTSTGVGHFQAEQLDIKYITEGEGIQFNVKYSPEGKIVEVLATYLKEGKFALSLPGYVDYMINLGGLRFNDISVRLTEEEIRKLGINPSEFETVKEAF